MSPEDLCLAVVTIAMAVMYTSMQQSGAALNSTVTEYRVGTTEGDTYLMRVRQTYTIITNTSNNRLIKW